MPCLIKARSALVSLCAYGGAQERAQRSHAG
jgi:hypothetical protein